MTTFVYSLPILTLFCWLGKVFLYAATVQINHSYSKLECLRINHHNRDSIEKCCCGRVGILISLEHTQCYDKFKRVNDMTQQCIYYTVL